MTASGIARARRMRAPEPDLVGRPSVRSSRMPRKRIPGVCPISVQKRDEDAAGEEQAARRSATITAPAESPSVPSPKIGRDDRREQRRRRSRGSRAAGRRRSRRRRRRVDEAGLVRLGLVVAAAERRCGRRARATSSSASVSRLTWRPMSVIRPKPCCGDRGPDLGRLGDPLDQHLRLVAGEDLLPDPIGDLAVDRPLDRLLELLLVDRRARPPPAGGRPR